MVCKQAWSIKNYRYVWDVSESHTPRLGFVEVKGPKCFTLWTSWIKLTHDIFVSLLFNAFTSSFPLHHLPHPLMVCCIGEMDDYHHILYFSFFVRKTLWCQCPLVSTLVCQVIDNLIHSFVTYFSTEAMQHQNVPLLCVRSLEFYGKEIHTSCHGFVERTNMFHLVASMNKVNLCTSSILFNSFTPSFPVLHHPYPLKVFRISEMDEHHNYHRWWICILYFSFLGARNNDVVILQFPLHWVKLEVNSFFILSSTLLLMQCDSKAYLLSMFTL
jgi:hypothetical protein